MRDEGAREDRERRLDPARKNREYEPARYLSVCVLLLVACVKECGVDAKVVLGDLDEQVGMLEDVAIDVPMAPKLLGYVCASLVVEGVAEASHVAASAEKIDEGGMPTRREYVAAVLKELKARGKKSVGEYVKEGGIDLAKLLTGDEKFDGPLDAFLEKNGLKEIAP